MRKIAAGSRDRIEDLLQHALMGFQAQETTTTSRDDALHALVADMAATFPPDINPEQRGAAAWRMVRDEVAQIALAELRTALTAALHLDPTNRETSIDRRLTFARDRGDFGVRASGRRIGYDALRQWWGEGVRLLGTALDSRVERIRLHPDEWRAYLPALESNAFRTPFTGAQPVFVDLLVTTAFMSGRKVQRRITDRLVTAQEDGVEYYTAWALPEAGDASTSVPVTSLWGCRAERMPSSAGEPILTRLWFPRPLQRGERHYFSSEAVPGMATEEERRVINVEVDHYGIAPGRRSRGTVPTDGLTIRISFDINDLPDAVWWYADVSERERYERPRKGDDRWLEVTSQGYTEHTFTEACQPRANYGVSFAWPSS